MKHTQTRNSATRQEKREAGETRNTAWRTLSASEQLVALDRRLGKGVGAQRQRAKLTETIGQAGRE